MIEDIINKSHDVYYRSHLCTTDLAELGSTDINPDTSPWLSPSRRRNMPTLEEGHVFCVWPVYLIIRLYSQ